MEVAIKLLEKDIHDKQDTIVSLRRQLEDIKLINLDMYNKLQVDINYILTFHALYFRKLVQLNNEERVEYHRTDHVYDLHAGVGFFIQTLNFP